MSVSVDSMLLKAPLFHGLSKKQIRRVLKDFDGRTFSPGHTIIAKGEPSGRLYLIMDGAVRVTDGDRELATLRPGEFFGEMSVIDGKPRSATVTAITSVRTVSVASWNFLSLMEENFAIARQVMLQLSERARDPVCS